MELKELISSMTLEEKASLCSGRDFWTTKPIERLNIPSTFVSDGPHGLRKEDDTDTDVGVKRSFPATAFPPAVNMAASWNEEAVAKVAEQIAYECKDQKVSVILGPGTNINRSPLCGRNFEYFSEDPYLAGKLARAYIESCQKHNVGTSLKHFAANNQEKLRMTISAVVDERALREIYLAPFEEAVKAQPWTIMCSYNRINGVYSSDNKRLLSDILRDEWGYKGLVVSDWNAVNDRVQGVRAGLDLEMPACGGRIDKEIVDAVKNGQLKEEELDKVVYRVLELVFKGQKYLEKDYKADYEKAHQVAKEMAQESIVLLKNENKVLPIKEKDVVVIGELANTFRYQGAGSSRINPYKLINFIDAMKQDGINVDFHQGYTLKGDGYNKAIFEDAVAAANTDKKVVVFIGLTDEYETEGMDRAHLSIPSAQDDLVRAIAGINKNAIFVLLGGSPIEMPWIEDVKTLLNAYLPGEAGGEAIRDVIYGKVNPSGKIAETYPIQLEDNINAELFPMGPKCVEHRESIFVGYRYYDAAKKNVLFPFGYGLSYTQFEYSNLVVDGNKVTFTIKNVGKVDGKEVCQLYIRDLEPKVFKADKELKGFKKVFIKAGEEAKVEIELDRRSFAFYNTKINDWSATNGKYEILVGASSRDIRLSEVIDKKDLDKKVEVENYIEECPIYYNMETIKSISQEDFKKLYKGEIPENVPTKRGQFDRNATIGDLRCCMIGKIIMWVAPKIIKSQVKNADFTTMLMITQGMIEMPLRGLNGVTQGLLDEEIMDGMLLWANKHRTKGFFKMIGGLFKTVGKVKNK